MPNSDTTSRRVLRLARLGPLICLAMLAHPFWAEAGLITTFSNRSTFTSTVGAVTVETFTSTAHFPISTGTLDSATNLPGIGITPGVIQAGVTYSTPVSTTNQFFFNIDSGGPPGFTGGFLDRLGDAPSQATGLTTTFTGAVRAFGFDASNFMGSTLNLIIRFSSGPSQTSTYSIGTGRPFFGFQSDVQDIVSATLWGTGEPTIVFAIDNFTYTAPAATAVPEPSSLALCGFAGLSALGCVSWRRMRIASA